jgi:hypothetical protein
LDFDEASRAARANFLIGDNRWSSSPIPSARFCGMRRPSIERNPRRRGKFGMKYSAARAGARSSIKRTPNFVPKRDFARFRSPFPAREERRASE